MRNLIPALERHLISVYSDCGFAPPIYNKWDFLLFYTNISHPSCPLWRAELLSEFLRFQNKGNFERVKLSRGISPKELQPEAAGRAWPPG